MLSMRKAVIHRSRRPDSSSSVWWSLCGLRMENSFHYEKDKNQHKVTCTGCVLVFLAETAESCQATT